jgi:hypothetical protein
MALLNFIIGDEAVDRQSSSRSTANSVRLRGEALVSLASTGLSAHFYSWLGDSGRRFICSVYQRGEENYLLGLPQSIIIGVARIGDLRVPKRLLLTQEATVDSDRRIFEESCALGVEEWHVHFGASETALGELAGLFLSPVRPGK